MQRKPPRGLFLTGTSTDVGKTYVGALIVRALVAAGYRVGVYKPAASGCQQQGDTYHSTDALELWNAAGRPLSFEAVCPQRFLAPLAPHLAAQAEGKRLDPHLLRSGLERWLDASDIVIVEGAGGLMSPISNDEVVMDLAKDFGFPLIVVAANALGVINHVLLTLFAAGNVRGGLPIAGVVLNRPHSGEEDLSQLSNRRELERYTRVLAEVQHQGGFDHEVDWFALAAEGWGQSNLATGRVEEC